jgi:hypothetical protein
MTYKSTGIELIAQERFRQISEEGYAAEHDDYHSDEEIASAAMCYACPPNLDLRLVVDSAGNSAPPIEWPWEPKYWKPGDRIAELAKAGALIAAEIDRILRKDASPP